MTTVCRGWELTLHRVRVLERDAIPPSGGLMPLTVAEPPPVFRPLGKPWEKTGPVRLVMQKSNSKNLKFHFFSCHRAYLRPPRSNRHETIRMVVCAFC